MNKILVSDIINLDNNNYILDIKTSKLIINNKGNNKVFIINNNIIEDLIINMDDYSTLNIYIYNICINNNLFVNINQNNNSDINYNMAFINNSNNKLIINNDLNGNNNKSNINIRNISNKDEMVIKINVNIAQNTFNNIALEDLKGICNGGIVHIEPNIDTLSNEVMANHLTTIGAINKDELNYLLSKGISINKAKKILLKGFIFSNMDDYIKDNYGGEIDE